MTTTFDLVKRLLIDSVGLLVEPERITPQAALVDDLGADSLDLIELVIDLEGELDIEIDDEWTLENCRTVGDLVAMVDARVAA